MKNSSVFTYSGAENTVALTAGMQNAWVATSNVALNDCEKGKKWTLNVMSNEKTGGSATYTADIEDEANCRQLTPSFEKLTTKTSDKSNFSQVTQYAPEVSGAYLHLKQKILAPKG